MPQIKVETFQDFTGGLNLTKDVFQLAANESPDLCNVDVSARGGFSLRRGITKIATSIASSAITGLHAFLPEDGAVQLLIRQTADGSYRHWTGSSWQNFTPSLSMAGGVGRSVTFKDRHYIVNGSATPVRITNTTTWTTLSSPAPANWNDNLENPTLPPANGRFPQAKLIASWMGCIFVAGVTEGSTFHPNRVRWSHPGFGEDWHSLHYIDIDKGAKGDAITALVPAGDKLLVFKRGSVHVIAGTPPEGLVTQPLTLDLGTMHQDSAVSTDFGVYFFDPIEGVFLLRDNGRVDWQFEPIHPAMRDGRISQLTIDKVILGWVRRRLWVSLAYEGSAERSDVFVLDPSLGSKSSPGAWVRYKSLRVGPFRTWNPSGQDVTFYAGGQDPLDSGTNQVMKLEQAVTVDDYGGIGETRHIDSWFQTAWADLGIPAAKKRWKRPDVIMKAGVEATITVLGYCDYDFGHPTRRFTLTSTGMGDYLNWGTGGGQHLWGSNRWSPMGERLNEIQRGSPLGTCRAVALRFEGPTDNLDWGVNQISFKYIPRKVRS